MTSSPAANMVFAIARVPCLANTFVQCESSVLRMKYIANTPRHRNPQNVISNRNNFNYTLTK